jgi:hypothetical protein
MHQISNPLTLPLRRRPDRERFRGDRRRRVELDPIADWLVGDRRAGRRTFPPPYVLEACPRALQWARKYGLRVAIDLHSAPGSQNGASRLLIQVQVFEWPKGIRQRPTNHRPCPNLTEFISQPEYAKVVPVFCIINEALVGTIGGGRHPCASRFFYVGIGLH